MKMRKSQILMTVMLVLGLVALGGLCFSANHTATDFKIARQESVADAVLASSSRVSEGATLPVTFYSQVADPCVNFYEPSSYHALINRTFEWSSCGEVENALEENLTADRLDENLLPVALSGGQKLPNRGVKAENFARFFNAVEGQSVMYPATITLNYADSTFKYEQDKFNPLSSLRENLDQDPRNQLFSMVLSVPFQVTSDGHEEFTIVADDDTWIFLEDQILLDLGGVHEATEAHFRIQNNGEIYTAVGGTALAYSGQKVKAGTLKTLRIFHVNRDSLSSVFKLYFKNMILNTLKTPQLARSENTDGATIVEGSQPATAQGQPATGSSMNGIQIAYSGIEDTGYMAPLGESYTLLPNRSHALLVSLVVQLTLIIVLAFGIAILILSFARSFRKNKVGKKRVSHARKK